MKLSILTRNYKCKVISYELYLKHVAGINKKAIQAPQETE